MTLASIRTRATLHKSRFLPPEYPFGSIGLRLGLTLAVSLRLTEPSYILIEAMPQRWNSLIFKLDER
jgi:hypothetical protein